MSTATASSNQVSAQPVQRVQRITVDLDAADHQALKVFAVLHQQTLRAVVIEALRTAGVLPLRP